MPTLYVREAGKYREAHAQEVLSCAQAFMAHRVRDGKSSVEHPQDLHEFLKIWLVTLEREVFVALFLDSRRRLIEYQELFRGAVDYVQVHPREIVKKALVRNAAGLVIVHNHPSRVPEPSQSDELIAAKIKEALALIDVRLLDHLIVGERVVSFRDRGLL